MERLIADFQIPGKPMGKQRPRHMRNGHTYTPKETVEYERFVGFCYLESYHLDDPSEKPIRMIVQMTMPIPTSWSKKKQTKANGQFCTTKPDCSNAIKTIEDGLLGLAYKDDSQIVILEIEKRYGTIPMCKVTIYEMYEEEQ